jgi:hypothetical protein
MAEAETASLANYETADPAQVTRFRGTKGCGRKRRLSGRKGAADGPGMVGRAPCYQARNGNRARLTHRSGRHGASGAGR